MSTANRTIRGIGWSGASQALHILLQFTITTILARLLAPRDFGLLAMIVVVTGFLNLFRDFGLAPAIVQRKKLTDDHLSSGFWINVLTGVLLALVLIATIPVVARFYREPRLIPVATVLASTFVISAFGVIQTALLTREFRFKALGLIEILAVSTGGALSIFLAICGVGVWSLVWQQIVMSTVTVLLLWRCSSWRPRLVFTWGPARELLGFGLHLTAYNFINYFSRNLDSLLIGKFLGASPLGVYNLAYRLSLFPMTNLSNVIGRVMFPGLSAIQHDKARVRYAYLKATRYLATVTFPLLAGLFVIAPQFVLAVFGPQWKEAIPLVRILAVVGLMQSISCTVGWIYTSQGRTDTMLNWGLAATPLTLVAFLVGLHWNVKGIAAAYLVVNVLLAYPSFAIPFRLVNLQLVCFLPQFGAALLASVLMGLSVMGVDTLLRCLGVGPTGVLTVAIAFGAIVYLGIMSLLDADTLREAFQLVLSSSRRLSDDPRQTAHTAIGDSSRQDTVPP